MALSTMPLDIMIRSIMPLRIMILSIIPISIITYLIMIMTISIMTLNIMALSIVSESCYAECHWRWVSIMPNVVYAACHLCCVSFMRVNMGHAIMQSVFVLSVVAPFKARSNLTSLRKSALRVTWLQWPLINSLRYNKAK
jgi:hypothetical protein